MPIRIIKVEDGKHQIITTDESHCNRLRRESATEWFREYQKNEWVPMLDYEKYEDALREWRRKQTTST